MSNRRIDDLDLSAAAGDEEGHGGEDGMAQAASASVPSGEPSAEKLEPTTAELEGALAPALLVDVNYPDPTLVSVVLRDVARWSGMSFVLEPRANVKVQIIAPRKLPPHIAYGLVMAALAVVRLRAVHDGGAVKIVSEWSGASA